MRAMRAIVETSKIYVELFVLAQHTLYPLPPVGVAARGIIMP
jgi:hypothetical protein